MTYNKLVRDNIPDIISKSGKRAITHIADDSEYRSRLLDKIVEEAHEIRESNGSLEELADLKTVLAALELTMSLEDRLDLLTIAHKKIEERGGFEKKIVLEEVLDD